MKIISYLQNRPAVLLIFVIIIITICIIAVIILLLYRLQNEKKVTRAALELKRITNSIRAGLVHFVLEDNCRILYASKGFYEVLGYDKYKAKDENKITLLDFLVPNNSGFIEDIKKQLGNETIRVEVKMNTKNGNFLYMLMNGNSSKGKDGKHKLSAVFVDINELKKMQEINLLEAERYRVATELSNDVLFEYHIQTDEMVHTDKYRDLFGMNPVIPGYIRCSEERRDAIHPDDWGIYLEFGQELSAGKSIIEAQFRIKNMLGNFIWCQIMGKTIYDDNKVPVRVIGKMVNVDTQKRELEELEYKATRDPLTGVYNKEITIKKIDKFLSGNKNGMHMLMLIDFDNFKKINDHYGHLQGDKVLSFMINRIKDVFSEGEIIGRIGGDEFVVFAGYIDNIDIAADKAKILRTALDATYINGSLSIPISGSIGVSLYPEDGIHYEQLMDRADIALYRVKEHGKNNYLFYSEAI